MAMFNSKLLVYQRIPEGRCLLPTVSGPKAIPPPGVRFRRSDGSSSCCMCSFSWLTEQKRSGAGDVQQNHIDTAMDIDSGIDTDIHKYIQVYTYINIDMDIDTDIDRLYIANGVGFALGVSCVVFGCSVLQ